MITIHFTRNVDYDDNNDAATPPRILDALALAAAAHDARKRYRSTAGGTIVARFW